MQCNDRLSSSNWYLVQTVTTIAQLCKAVTIMHNCVIRHKILNITKIGDQILQCNTLCLNITSIVICNQAHLDLAHLLLKMTNQLRPEPLFPAHTPSSVNYQNCLHLPISTPSLD